MKKKIHSLKFFIRNRIVDRFFDISMTLLFRRIRIQLLDGVREPVSNSTRDAVGIAIFNSFK